MIIRTQSDRQAFIDRANTIDLSKNAWVFSADKFKKKRSTAMNSLLYAWYSEIAKYTGEGIDHARGYIKWEYGVPILLARGEPEFDDLINSIVSTMQYEQILKLFAKDTIAISSVMKVPEFLDYLTNIEHYCFEQKIPLAQNDSYEEAMGLTRDKPK